ncbi:outer membrane protein assembly factor BamD [Alkanindiges sp. WGS2144]|uniref:outer membrane protein assembly factor BamD n=1 Tax=Alkanindiges sp. WGS2144 TaxID=3366808 RepID=UPI003750C148
MSLPRFSVLMLSLSVAIAGGMAGCSSFPKKKNDLKDSGPQRSEQAYYEAAQKNLKRGQYTEANKSLEALDTYYPTGNYTEQAQLDLMYSRFKQGDYPGVITVAERFIRMYPNNPQLDYAYYIRGVANMEQHYDGLLRYTSLDQSHRDVNYLRLAYSSLREFIQRFPDSHYAVDAAQRMQYINQELAESEMNIARFNIKRQAWLAAIQRARWVLEYYPQTPQIPEALATIVHGYQKLGDQQTASQYMDIIRLNYPQLVKGDSVDLKKARGQASLVNRLTLGILGREAQNFIPKDAQNVNTAPPPPAATPASSEELGTEPVDASKPEKSPEEKPLKDSIQAPGFPSIGLGLPDETSAQPNP